MEIKGNIGQEILISGIIKKIMVDENGLVQYDVRVFGSDFSFWLPSPDIVFKTAEEVLNEELTAEELSNINVTDCDSSETEPETEEESFAVEQPKKKRGRPRKATVENLMKIADEVERKEN